MVSGGLLADLGATCDVDGCEHRAIIASTRGRRVCGTPHLRRVEVADDW